MTQSLRLHSLSWIFRPARLVIRERTDPTGKGDASPQELTVMIETIARVESNRELSPGYRLLTLSFREPISVRAGQFAMLKPRASFEPLLRRAFAVYRVESPRRLSFLYQVL